MDCKVGEMFLWEGNSNAIPVPVEAFRGKVRMGRFLYIYTEELKLYITSYNTQKCKEISSSDNSLVALDSEGKLTR